MTSPHLVLATTGFTEETEEKGKPSAFVTTEVLNVLVEKFDLKPIGRAEDDIKKIVESKRV